MKSKKITCMFLTAAIVLSTAFGQTVLTAETEAAETDKITVYVAAEGVNAAGTEVSVDKTPVQVEEGATAEDAIKTVLDASAYAGNYTISSSAWGDSLDEINGLAMEQSGNDWYYWSFYVNNAYSLVGIGSYALQDQDKISLVYTYNNYNTQASCYADDTSKNPTGEAIDTLVDNAAKAQYTLASKIYETTFSDGSYIPGIEDASSLYTVYSLARTGFGADSFYDAVYTKVNAQLEVLASGGKVYDSVNDKYISQDSILSDGYASQTYAKIAMCVSALGKDAANVGGFDIISKLVDKDVYNASSVYSRETMILMAIDSESYDIPDGTDYLTRADLVTYLVNDVDAQIATAISWSSLDCAAMAVQPLATYTNSTDTAIDTTLVKKAIAKVTNLLGSMQGADGAYSDAYYSNNPWTVAQVMLTAGVSGADILSESDGTDFVKNGVTLLDDALAFVNSSDNTVDSGLMAFQPEQLLRGINACLRSINKSNSIILATDAAYTAQASDKTALTESMIGKISSQTYTGKKLTPAVKVTDGNKTLKKGTDYTVAYSNNIKTGTATVVVTGTGDYILSQKVTFKITLAKAKISKLVSAKKQITATYSKVTGAKKYEVQVSTDKKFKKNVVSTKTTKTNAIVKKLKSGKKYFVRVRAISGSDKGSFSKVKNVTVK